MIKLVYDLKCGFEELYIVEKDCEYDLTQVVEMNKELLHTDVSGEDQDAYISNCPIAEEQLYEKFKDNLEALLDYLDDCGHLLIMEDCDRLRIAHTYLSNICFAKNKEPYAPGIWKPTNFRLVFDPTKKSNYYFINAFSTKETCKILNISRQQLHYYVKTAQIHKEYNEDKTKFGYNRTDVYAVLDKLEAKRPTALNDVQFYHSINKKQTNKEGNNNE